MLHDRQRGMIADKMVISDPGSMTTGEGTRSEYNMLHSKQNPWTKIDRASVQYNGLVVFTCFLK